MSDLPQIREYQGADTLFVHNQPFLILGGEIHNSSASSLGCMAEKVWPNLAELNLNTVLVPIYWELVEKVEGQFDYSLIDGIIDQARKYNKRLVLLWFGLWKNAESSYVPGWMKTNPAAYFRARKVNGEAINAISPFCQAAVEKDAHALAHVMAHLREVDAVENTVLLIQVENEIGLLGTDRDYSPAAEEEFARQVPPEVEQAFSVQGSWQVCFGEQAGEHFMAWAFARAVEVITQAAQKEYPLPCYANAWLKQYPWYPGSYPSGGPVASMHKMWKLMAPSLFCLAPDIYVPYVPQVMAEYARADNPLFVPEVRKDAVTASYALYAFGQLNAIGYSPFAVEELALDPKAIAKPPLEVMIALNIDPSAFEIEGSKETLAGVYGLMENIQPLYFKYRATPHLKSYVRHGETDFGAFFNFAEYDVLAAYAPRQPHKPLAAGMIYEVAENCFYLLGMMSEIKFLPKPGENLKVDILKLEEGQFLHGEWVPARVLNGDEKMSLRLGDQVTCLYVEVFKY